MIDAEKIWETKFPELVNLLACQFGQDFFLYGTTIEALAHDFASRSGLEDTTKVISEINRLISLMKDGEIDPDQFLEDLREETIPKYDHLSTLEYFEAIRDALETSKKAIYG